MVLLLAARLLVGPTPTLGLCCGLRALRALARFHADQAAALCLSDEVSTFMSVECLVLFSPNRKGVTRCLRP